jgi:uncharacterized protein (DUF39 family)
MLELPYIRKTNCFSVVKVSSVISLSTMAKRALVAPGNAFQVFYTVFFPLPAKMNTVSHHVKA